jgi:hypothetical protein
MSNGTGIFGGVQTLFMLVILFGCSAFVTSIAVATC